MTDRAEPDGREASLISRVMTHDDHEAFAALVRLHQSPVRQFLRRLTAGDWSRADDLAQETFFRAYRHIRTYAGRGRFLSWLFRIAYQLFVTELRSRHGVVHVALPFDLPAAGDPAQRIADARTFDQLMDMLEGAERAALVLHYRHELSHPEIAETMDLPLGTVKTLIRRARIKLQEAGLERKREAGR